MSGWWRNRAGYARVGLDGEEDASARDAASSPPLSRAEKAEASAALGGFFGEGVAQLRLALPVSLSMICNRVMSLTSVAFVGHLGSLPLAGAALATTLGNVTGNSVMVGMASACSTLGGQAFGAERYSELGRVTQRALVILTLAACPIALSWSAAEPALLALGQDPAIARASATYLETLIPGLFFYAWNVVLQAYMQSQGITKPGAVAGVVAALLHVPANVAFLATPRRVPGVGRVTSLAAGGNFNVAVAAEGVVSWGANGNGELGSGARADGKSDRPRTAIQPPRDARVTSVAVPGFDLDGGR